MILDELRAEGDELEWYPIGLRGSEERVERWLLWFALREAHGAPPRLFEMAEQQVRRQPLREPPGRVEISPGLALAVRRAYEARRDSTTEIDLPAVGRVSLAVAKAIGGTLMLTFMSGFRTYTGATILMLSGIAAICTALAGLLGLLQTGDLAAITGMEWWAAIVAGAGVFGQGLSQLGIGGKLEKQTAAQVAIAKAQPAVAAKIALGDLPPNAAAR